MLNVKADVGPIQAELNKLQVNLNDLEDYADKLKALLEIVLMETPGIGQAAPGAQTRPVMCPLVAILDGANDHMIRIRLKLGAIMDSIQL